MTRLKRRPVRLGQVFELLKEKPEKRINCDLKTPGLEIPYTSWQRSMAWRDS